MAFYNQADGGQINVPVRIVHDFEWAVVIAGRELCGTFQSSTDEFLIVHPSTVTDEPINLDNVVRFR